MAAELGTDLTRVTVGARDIGELLPRAIELSEKPTLRTALAPLLRLSGAVQDAGLKVVLTGEGADELFAGYDIFREDKVRRFWARDPDSRLRPLLFGRLNAFLARDVSRSGAFLSGFYGRGLTEVDDPLYSHRIRFANTARCLTLFQPELLGRAAAADDSAGAPRRAAPGALRRLQLARQGAVPRDHDLPRGLPAALAGRPDADGPLDRGPLPVPRLPRGRARGAAARPAAAARAGGEVRAAQGGGAAAARGGVPRARSVPTGRRSARSSSARTRPSTSASCCSRSASRRPGLFSPEAVRRVVAKFEAAGSARAGETDEMALVGAVSTMLLHEQLVARPSLAPDARADPGRRRRDAWSATIARRSPRSKAAS